MTHPPDQCPTANKTVRNLMLSSANELPALGKKHGIEFLAGPLITTQHKSVSIVKAPNERAIRDFVLESGFIQWNQIEVTHGVALEEAIQEINRLKTIY